jgi:hypothetical protein
VIVEVGTEQFQARARDVAEPERTRLYDQMAAQMAGLCGRASKQLALTRLNPNWYTCSVEHGGLSGQPQSASVYDADVELYAWLARPVGWDRLVVGDNLIGHFMIDPLNVERCPVARLICITLLPPLPRA